MLGHSYALLKIQKSLWAELVIGWFSVNAPRKLNTLSEKPQLKGTSGRQGARTSVASWVSDLSPKLGRGSQVRETHLFSTLHNLCGLRTPSDQRLRHGYKILVVITSAVAQ